MLFFSYVQGYHEAALFSPLDMQSGPEGVEFSTDMQLTDRIGSRHEHGSHDSLRLTKRSMAYRERS